MTPAEAAGKALTLLERDGWAQGITLVTDDMHAGADAKVKGKVGARCLGGMLNTAMYDDPYWQAHPSTDVFKVVAQKILELHPDYEFPQLTATAIIVDWNDRESRTEADIREILEKVATDV